MKFHSPPILRVQSCLTDAVVVIFLDYCFTDTHLKPERGFFSALAPEAETCYNIPVYRTLFLLA